ncbi:P-loop ATPase, Sll1717 family [Idiomarina xiamenensis]|uniref:ATPase n=1 Tax=Idiomarina xiamenensis 10-D-4 TaxID=740709 RepID=K2KYN4_9GAMM|nr:hypothetical protein [Idiomarina xiamenensis]EKE87644.1 hypothetical protein A10D4_01080 [Idiomarina xiamenensis 10-D-4]
MEMLKEISEWKLDAKFEDSGRYFFHDKDVSAIEAGKYSYVIGRKGVGKTAISQNIFSKNSHDVFCEKLTFKNFPFNSLYELNDEDYTQPNQYITLWKYLIYSSICRMFVRNEAVDNEVRLELEKIYGSVEPINNLRRIIKKWVANEWSVKFLGLGGKVKLSEDNGDQTWIEKVDVLEDVISRYIDEANYYIVFDELDEDYSSIIKTGGQSNYLSLITSLFKAVQDIKSIFPSESSGVKPVVFLRDDIYDLLTDSDKTKWNDFRLDLDWDKNTIKDLIAFRLTRAKYRASEPLSFKQAWALAFSPEKIEYGNRQKKQTDVYTYIAKSTQLRPRDFVRYLQVCAKEAVSERRTKIGPDIVKKVDKAFSNYLKEELIDEIHGVLPDIKEILMVISEIRKQNFTIEEFKEQYSRAVETGTVTTKNAELALKILFHFSVVGNEPRQRQLSFFRYQNKESRINFNERLVVHRGLFKALQIL